MEAVELAKEQSLLFNVFWIALTGLCGIAGFLVKNAWSERGERLKDRDETIKKLEAKIDFYERQK